MWWSHVSLEEVSSERDDDPERETEERRITSLPVLPQPGTSTTDQPGPSVILITRSHSAQHSQFRTPTRRRGRKSRSKRRVTFQDRERKSSTRRSRLDLYHLASQAKGDSPQKQPEDVESQEGANSKGETFKTEHEFDEEERVGELESSSSKTECSPSLKSESVSSLVLPSDWQGAASENVYRVHAKVKAEKGCNAEPEKTSPTRFETRQQPDLNISEIADEPITNVPGPSGNQAEPLQRTREDYTSLGAVPKIISRIKTRPKKQSINQEVCNAGISPPTRHTDRSSQTDPPLVPTLQSRSTETETEPIEPAEPGCSNVKPAPTIQKKSHSVSTTDVEHQSEALTPYQGYIPNLVFLDVLTANPKRIMILVRKSYNAVAIFVILPSNQNKFISVFVLNGKLLKPITSLDPKPLTNTHQLSAFVRELKEYLPAGSTGMSEWSMIDRDMTKASIEIFKRNPEIAPEILYTLMAENLFTDINSMLVFFSDHYASYREEQLYMIRQRLRRAQKHVLYTPDVESLTGQVAGMSIAGRTGDEDTEQLEKQWRYIEKLKPPIKLPKLPSRPRYRDPIMETPKEEPRHFVAMPPTPAELARVQACYERDGRPRIKSKPRQPETSEKDEQ